MTGKPRTVGNNTVTEPNAGFCAQYVFQRHGTQLERSGTLIGLVSNGAKQRIGNLVIGFFHHFLQQIRQRFGKMLRQHITALRLERLLYLAVEFNLQLL